MHFCGLEDVSREAVIRKGREQNGGRDQSQEGGGKGPGR